MKLVTAMLMVAGAAVAAGIAFVFSGWYDISATDQHLPPTYAAIRVTMERSIERRARDIVAPALGSREQLDRGLALYRAHCVQCHGAPGVAPEPFALALRPLPRPLMRSGKDRSPPFLFWTTKHGIKMTGMPAWEFRMGDEDIWAVVAFLRELPSLSPQAYAAWRTAAPVREASTAEGAADLERGKRALEQYACVACHRTPGVLGPEAEVGPPLHGVGGRKIIAGLLPNNAANMERWIRTPREVKPQTAMPDLGVSARDARDMAAYLATLR